MTNAWQLVVGAVVVGVAVWASRTTAQPTPSRGDPPTVAPWKDYDPSVVRLALIFFLPMCLRDLCYKLLCTGGGLIRQHRHEHKHIHTCKQALENVARVLQLKKEFLRL